jgi:hypothetical protein
MEKSHSTAQGLFWFCTYQFVVFVLIVECTQQQEKTATNPQPTRKSHHKSDPHRKTQHTSAVNPLTPNSHYSGRAVSRLIPASKGYLFNNYPY